MLFNDRVYGEIEITEPVLLELINSKPLQRLKGVSQSGASKFVLRHLNVSRFEHCVGVMILLKKLNASVEEQIAGLLHDVPHTAFSHVIDYVFKSEKQDFHEKFHKTIIMNSEIPNILKKYGFNVNRLMDEHNFPLLERNSPDLCADRIDYTLRDFVVSFGFQKKISDYVSGLIVKNNEIIFNDAVIAKSFAEDYLLMDRSHLSALLEVGAYQILADALKIALDKNIISESDLFEDDDFVYKKLKESKDALILKKLNILNPDLKIVDDENDYAYFLKFKLRFVDPKFLENNDVCRVSERFPDFLNLVSAHKKRQSKGFFVKIV